MGIVRRRFGLVRLRPGHLANFSGGAGYMPCITVLSVPTSLLLGLISSLVLHARARALLHRKEDADDATPRTALYQFVRYAHWHTVICAVLAIALGIAFFALAYPLLYSDNAGYIPVTIVFASGPLAAWFLSTVLLVRLIVRNGAVWTNLAWAALAHLLMLFCCLPLILLISAITGAPV